MFKQFFSKNVLKCVLIICVFACIFTACGDTSFQDSGGMEADREADTVQDKDAESEEEITGVDVQEGMLKVTFLPVGKGDCAVLQTSDNVVMIDTGFTKTSDIVTDFLDENGIRRIDALIITHFDKDHVGGAADIISKYEIGVVYVTDYSENEIDSKPYRRYEEACEDNSVDVRVVNQIREIPMADAVLTIYPPMQKKYNKDPDNNLSLAATVVHGENTMLFAGDAEKQRIYELMDQLPIWDYTLFKVPHHGHYEDNSAEFFKKVSAEYAVICAGDEDEADEESIKALEDAESTVFNTCKGSITALSNGETLTVMQRNE